MYIKENKFYARKDRGWTNLISMLSCNKLIGVSTLQTKHGLSVVNACNIDEILRQKSIFKWPRIKQSQNLNDYLASEEGLRDERLRKFIPKDEVVSFRNPLGEIFRGIRRETVDGVVVFSIIPGEIVPICAEFKHGIEEISINLPGGGNHHNEEHSHIAKEEFEQETGIVLSNIVELSPLGISSDARIHKNRTFYFLGTPSTPLIIKDRKLDKEEILEPLLIPLKEWLKLIEMNKVIDGQSVVCTYLALAKLGYIKI